MANEDLLNQGRPNMARLLVQDLADAMSEWAGRLHCEGFQQGVEAARRAAAPETEDRR